MLAELTGACKGCQLSSAFCVIMREVVQQYFHDSTCDSTFWHRDWLQEIETDLSTFVFRKIQQSLRKLREDILAEIGDVSIDLVAGLDQSADVDMDCKSDNGEQPVSDDEAAPLVRCSLLNFFIVLFWIWPEQISHEPHKVPWFRCVAPILWNKLSRLENWYR